MDNNVIIDNNTKFYHTIKKIAKFNPLLANSFLFSLLYLYYSYNYNDTANIYKNVENIQYCKNINAYSLSPFMYTLTGLCILKYKTKFKYYDKFYPIFLILQGFISFISDSKYIDEIHWSHPFDKTLATYNLFICIIIASKYKINNIRWLLIFSGILSFKLGTLSFNYNKVYQYCFFHFLWHTIIPITSIFTIIENSKYIM